MGVTALPMGFARVLGAFGRKVIVRDCEGRRNAARAWEEGAMKDGEWVKGAYEERTVTAVVLAMKPADLELYGDGEFVGGGISLATDAELYVPDPETDAGHGGRNRQSYVLCQGRRYRVTGDCLIYGNTNLRLYHALRSMQ